jgi:hypothetical protein
VLPRRLLALLVAAGVLAIGALAGGARAETPVPAALQPILAPLSRTATPEQYQQILGAVNASPMLAKELEILVTRRKLAAITVLPGHSTAGSPYNAWADRSQIVLHADFLKAQLANRTLDVVHTDDVLPNNTVFCLGHLAYHLAIEDPSPQGASLQTYLRQRLEREAGAFIQGWNNVVDAAVQTHGGKPLSSRQVAQLLLNMRYRFALMKAEISPNGFIETSPRNIDAIVGVLRVSPLTDIQ